MTPSPAILAAVARHVPGFTPTAPPEMLTGGNLNHVWRLRYRSAEERDATFVLKHAPPYVAAQPNVLLSPERLAFEARALGLFQTGGTLGALTSDLLRPPRLIVFDSEHHFLLAEDVGVGSDLAAGLGDDAARIGRKLGTFIGALHRATAHDAALARAFDNHAIQETRLHVQYLAAAGLARAVGIDSTTVAQIDTHAATLGRQLLAPGRCLVMGDLWPPSILMSGKALRLIDWEFAHYGHPLQDVAHFGAHCWMQAHTAATPAHAQRFHALWTEFIAGYRTHCGSLLSELLPPTETHLMNVHAGAEILLRCAGPFVTGYRYAGFARDHRLIREALAQSIRLLTAPAARFFLE